MRIGLLIPPFTDPNAPFPSTTCLAGYLKLQGYEVTQTDLGIDVLNALFSKSGLSRLREALENVSLKKRIFHSHLSWVLKNFDQIIAGIEPGFEFYRGRQRVLSSTILNGQLLPLPKPFSFMRPAQKGPYIDTLADEIFRDLLQILEAAVRAVEPLFNLRHLDNLADPWDTTFDAYEKRLQADCSFLDLLIMERTEKFLQTTKPDLLGITIPFSNTLYGALRIGKFVKENFPATKVAIGGGFCNTSLRNLSDKRVFQYVDFICLDDGERPLHCLIQHLEGKKSVNELLRTYLLSEDRVQYFSSATEHDVPHKDRGTPTYAGLPVRDYFPQPQKITSNPFLQMVYNNFWNKLTIAHGCYWKKCTFCDIKLDYIARYDPAPAKHLLEQMESLMAETGSRGFHFVDEACPPSLMGSLSSAIIERDLKVVWYGNIRFDKAFTPELVARMARAGCVGVTGGLEITSDRILKLMEKGTTLKQVTQVAKAFAEAGIYVHGYLIYGFPTQTEQEIIDCLEVVRQLFEEGYVASVAWHEFLPTEHSPIGIHPEKFGIKLAEREIGPNGLFSTYSMKQVDLPVDYDQYGRGLNKATGAYATGTGFEKNLQEWFSFPVPATSVSPGFVRSLLLSTPNLNSKMEGQDREDPPMARTALRLKEVKSDQSLQTSGQP